MGVYVAQFAALMDQLGELHTELAMAHESAVQEFSEEVRRLRGQLNAARMSGKCEPTGQDDPDSDSDTTPKVTDAADMTLQDVEDMLSDDTASKGREDSALDPPTPPPGCVESPIAPGGAPPTVIQPRVQIELPMLLDMGGADQKQSRGKSQRFLDTLSHTDAQDAEGPIRSASKSSTRGPLRSSTNGAQRRKSYQLTMQPTGCTDSGSKELEPWPMWFDVTEGADIAVASRVYKTQKSIQWVKARTRGLLISNKRTLIARIADSLKINPTSLQRLLWLALGLQLIAYDLIVIPMSVFDIAPGLLMKTMSYISAVYWTLDFGASFFVGFHVKGTLEARFRKTARRYASSWMCIDLLLVLVDWVSIGVDNTLGTEAHGASAARALRWLRWMRYLRTVRLMRVLKLPALLKQISFLGRSQHMSLILGIVKQLAGILMINHLIACVWYWLGANTSGGWVSHDYLLHGDVWELRYLVSLHWSLTQFTPASMSVQPHNLLERAFAVAVLLFALVTFSSFVSAITNLMTHLRSLKSAEAKQFSKLERYLQDNKISLVLSLRVRRYLEHHLSEQKLRTEEKDIELLSFVSEPLMMELHYEVYSSVLSKHPFFLCYSGLNRAAMKRLCHTAIRTIHLSMDDTLFSDGDTAKAMFFVVDGNLEYLHRSGQQAVKLLAGEWIAEMVLWTPWEHHGETRANTESSLVALDSTTFHKVILGSKAGQLEGSAYAIHAVNCLNEVVSCNEELMDTNASNFDATAIATQVFGSKAVIGESWWKRAVTKQLHGGRTSQDRVSVVPSELSSNTRSSKSSEDTVKAT